MNDRHELYFFDRATSTLRYEKSCQAPITKSLGAEDAKRLNEAVAAVTLLHWMPPSNCTERAGGEMNFVVIELPSETKRLPDGNPGGCGEIDYLDGVDHVLDTMKSLI